MPKGYPAVSAEVKDQILNRIKEKGEKASDLAKEFGIKPRNIYSWLSQGATEPNTVLELAKIKRDQQALLAIIGQLFAGQKLVEKKRNSYGNK